jgi:predicted aspartyl protease
MFLTVTWRAILTAALVGAVLAGADAAAVCRSAPERAAFPELAAEVAAGPTETDRAGRVVAPIHINGRGPYRFIIDTGANRSALSQRLAQALGLIPTRQGEVHSVYGVAPAPIVSAQSLSYENIALPSTDLPILGGGVLAGEHGLLGADGMEGRRLLLDFERGCIEIVSSRGARGLAGWVQLRGELRFGQLIVVRGRISGVRVNVLLDTGSDTSLANMALYEALEARLRRITPQRALTANAPILLNRAILIRRLELGPMQANNFPAYVGDFHVFSLWNMVDEPTLLLGMDVISKSRAMAIDYGRGSVYFRAPQ